VYSVTYTTAFLRDLAKCEKKHWNVDALEKAIEELMSSDERPLAPRYKDHALFGSWKGFRELHIGSRISNWILIYQIDGLELYLTRTGTHDEMFN